MSENIQSTLTGLFLAGACIFTYRVKMQYDEPEGMELWAWRLCYFGAFLVFSSTPIAMWTGVWIFRFLLIGFIGIGGVLIVAGFILFLMSSYTDP
jgi:hypothetical protein